MSNKLFGSLFWLQPKEQVTERQKLFGLVFV
jgi:hypothetical protein